MCVLYRGLMCCSCQDAAARSVVSCLSYFCRLGKTPHPGGAAGLSSEKACLVRHSQL